MEGSPARLRELLTQYSEVLANLSEELAAPSEQGSTEVEEGLRQRGSPVSNDELSLPASSIRPQRRRRLRDNGQLGNGGPVETPEATNLISQPSAQSAPPGSSLPATDEGEDRPLLPLFNHDGIATMRGLIIGVDQTAEAIQKIASELRSLSARIGGGRQPADRERLGLDTKARAILDVAALTIAIAEEARAAARLAGEERIQSAMMGH